MVEAEAPGSATPDDGPWHGDFAGTFVAPLPLPDLRFPNAALACTGHATEPLLALLALLLSCCVLTGHWWLLAYALLALALMGLVIIYAVYLQYNTERYLEQQRAAMMAAQIGKR